MAAGCSEALRAGLWGHGSRLVSGLLAAAGARGTHLGLGGCPGSAVGRCTPGLGLSLLLLCCVFIH